VTELITQGSTTWKSHDGIHVFGKIGKRMRVAFTGLALDMGAFAQLLKIITTTQDRLPEPETFDLPLLEHLGCRMCARADAKADQWHLSCALAEQVHGSRRTACRTGQGEGFVAAFGITSAEIVEAQHGEAVATKGIGQQGKQALAAHQLVEKRSAQDDAGTHGNIRHVQDTEQAPTGNADPQRLGRH
jgi:hypothetical protein